MTYVTWYPEWEAFMANKKMGFWTGGPEACRAGLKDEYQATVAELKKKLKKAETAEERRQIADELEQVEDAYRERLRQLSECLF
jgi:hypothetical protein